MVAKAGMATINVINRKKYLFIIGFSCKDAKNTRGLTDSFAVKIKISVNKLHRLNNLIIRFGLQTGFPIDGKDYFCKV